MLHNNSIFQYDQDSLIKNTIQEYCEVRVQNFFDSIYHDKLNEKQKNIIIAIIKNAAKASDETYLMVLKKCFPNSTHHQNSFLFFRNILLKKLPEQTEIIQYLMKISKRTSTEIFNELISEKVTEFTNNFIESTLASKSTVGRQARLPVGDN